MNSFEGNPFNPETTSAREKDEAESYKQLYLRPQIQFLVSSLVRGPMNAAQVVKKGDTYYSHRQKLENTEPKEDTRLSIQADALILQYVFRDNEHVYYKKHRADMGRNQEEHLNLITNKQETRGVLFDFDAAFSPEKNDPVEEVKEVLAKDFSPEDAEGVARIIQEKTEAYLAGNFISDDMVKAIIKKGDINLTSNEFRPYFSSLNISNEPDGSEKNEKLAEVLFNDLHSRFELLKKNAEDYLQEHLSK